VDGIGMVPVVLYDSLSLLTSRLDNSHTRFHTVQRKIEQHPFRIILEDHRGAIIKMLRGGLDELDTDKKIAYSLHRKELLALGERNYIAILTCAHGAETFIAEVGDTGDTEVDLVPFRDGEELPERPVPNRLYVFDAQTQLRVQPDGLKQKPFTTASVVDSELDTPELETELAQLETAILSFLGMDSSKGGGANAGAAAATRGWRCLDQQTLPPLARSRTARGVPSNPSTAPSGHNPRPQSGFRRLGEAVSYARNQIDPEQ